MAGNIRFLLSITLYKTETERVPKAKKIDGHHTHIHTHTPSLGFRGLNCTERVGDIGGSRLSTSERYSILSPIVCITLSCLCVCPATSLRPQAWQTLRRGGIGNEAGRTYMYIQYKFYDSWSEYLSQTDQWHLVSLVLSSHPL